MGAAGRGVDRGIVKRRPASVQRPPLVPSLEALEGREGPGRISLNNGVLKITGTAAADTVTVTQDDANNRIIVDDTVQTVIYFIHRGEGRRHSTRYHASHLTENRRTISVRLPCLSFTETVSLPASSAAIGRGRVHCQTPSPADSNFGARFSPRFTPGIAKPAVTVKLARSRPVP